MDDLNHFPNYNAKTFAAFLIYLKILVSLKILLVNVGYFSSNVSNIGFIQIPFQPQVEFDPGNTSTLVKIGDS